MNQISKTMATLAVGGLVMGLAACGGGTPAADSQATPGAGTEAHSCKGEGDGAKHECKADGKCGARQGSRPGRRRRGPRAGRHRRAEVNLRERG